MEQQSQTKPKKPRGFACLTPERRREIARAGGRAAQASGRGHRYTADEARAAGKRGGAVIGARTEHMKAIGKRGGLKSSQDREHMRAIARKGGQASRRNAGS